MPIIRPATVVNTGPALVSGGGARHVVGQGIASAADAIVQGSGEPTIKHTGAGVAIAQAASVTALSSVTRIASGFAQAQASIVNGFGTSGSPESWPQRSTAPLVKWSHRLDNIEELDLFTRVSSAVSNPTRANYKAPLTLKPSKLGGNAIVSKGYGSELAQAVPAAAAQNEEQTWQMVNVVGLPDPAGAPYSARIGNGAIVVEQVLVKSIDYDNDTITLDRWTTSENTGENGGAHPAGYTLGFQSQGEWVRPFAAFPAGQNGRAVPDVGIANGSVTKARVWNTAKDSPTHRDFREGYIGHNSYWLTGGQTYKDWTPFDPADNLERPDAWDGNKVFFQFRASISHSRFEAPEAKMLFVQNCNVGGSSQLYWGVGPQKYDEERPAPDGETHYGMFLSAITCYGDDTSAPAGYVLAPDGQFLGFDTDTNPLQEGYTECYWDNREAAGGTGMKCWTFPAESIVTFLVAIDYGLDNSDNPGLPPPGPWSATPPWPADTNPEYRTHVEIYVAEEGETTYTTLLNRDQFVWLFGDNKQEWGNYFYNPPGVNAVWLSQNLNDYVGAGSVPPAARNHEIRISEIICSSGFIPVPDDPNTVLDNAVEALSVGEFAVFNTDWSGLGPGEWRPNNGEHSARWNVANAYHDPERGKIVFIGSGYDTNTVVVTYDIATDTWSRVIQDNRIIHAWDHTAYDRERGIFYYGSQAGGQQWSFPIDDQENVTAGLPTHGSTDTYGMEYFPEIDSVIVYNYRDVGTLHRRRTGQNFTTIGTPGVYGLFNGFCTYNPRRGVVYFGPGTGGTGFFELDIGKNVTSLPAKPWAFDCVRAHPVCSDVSENLILIDCQNERVREYRPGAGWTGDLPGITFPGGFIGNRENICPLHQYPGKEIFMIMVDDTGGGTGGTCYLYRHS